MTRPDVSIIIVNWKVRALLEKCLNSILAETGNKQLEIIVVDNDSADGTSEMVMMEYPMIRMIALPQNIGFAAANNLALEQAHADIIFLLNPDTEVTDGFFEEALKYFKNNPSVDIVGPKIINPDGSNQSSVRRFPDLLSQILIMLKLKNILVDNKLLSNYLANDFNYSKEQEVEQIMGAAMLIRRNVFEKIGKFDEKFFIWFEEVDFCLRAVQAGLKIKYIPYATIIHKGGESFSQRNSLRKQIIFNKSILRYFFKHKPFIEWLIILLIIPINILLTVFYVIFLKNKYK
ncbi:glycosyltransferase family 2 protein [Patescibacteria group bacterium]|nr:glycosyltransferase family 2 protein [Patescibacteria group bacterium]